MENLLEEKPTKEEIQLYRWKSQTSMRSIKLKI